MAPREEDVDELIREARAEARAAVKARLREDFERALAREVEERLAPRPARPVEEGPATHRSPIGGGLWVYCAVRQDFPELPDELEGVHSAARPNVVRGAGAAAVVSVVPLDQFGEDALKRNLNDIEWLEAVARAHEDVLEAALGSGPIVPMRICTIFRGEEQVRRMLADGESAFSEALDRLDGRAEWGVKVIADRARVAQMVRTRGRSASSGSSRASGPAGEGGAYLGRKQEDRYLRELVDVVIDEAVRESHARLEEWAAASELLPPQRPEVAGYEGELVLNGAYLVDHDRVEAFEGVVQGLSHQYSDAGLSFDLTGPWPAFHFVGRLDSMGERVS
jgi:hypothetical protein